VAVTFTLKFHPLFAVLESKSDVTRTLKAPVAAASASREGSGVPVKRASQAADPGDRDKNKVGKETERFYRDYRFNSVVVTFLRILLVCRVVIYMSHFIFNTRFKVVCPLIT
jgi:hypothetical protein